MCNSCGVPKCSCVKVISKTGQTGKRGPRGKDGRNAFITVKDGVVNTVPNVNEIRFTDSNAVVTSPATGVAQVNFIQNPTVWSNIQNLAWYVTNGATDLFRPQYNVSGNKVSFRGLLYIPLENAGSGVDVSANNSYLGVASAILREARVSIITNANSNNGTPQGRFMTTDIVSAKNFPANAIPQTRDIVFDNVPCYRRYTSGRVALYRSIISLRIGSLLTVYKNGVTNVGSGCIMVFSPFNDEYDGAGTAPLGNDPLALAITNVLHDENALNYIASRDDYPFAVPDSTVLNPFDCNAHKINSLGGFIINLENLSGYLN